jgi:hypothetical protein
MSKLNELVDRYVSVWNEPDAERRRQGIAALWAEDGARHSKRGGTRRSRPESPAPTRNG